MIMNNNIIVVCNFINNIIYKFLECLKVNESNYKIYELKFVIS